MTRARECAESAARPADELIQTAYHRSARPTISQDAQVCPRPRELNRGVLGYVEDFDEPRTKLADFFSILLELIRLLFHLLLLNQAGQVRALELEAVCCFCLIALRFFDGSLDDVAAMFFHRLMVRE